MSDVLFRFNGLEIRPSSPKAHVEAVLTAMKDDTDYSDLIMRVAELWAQANGVQAFNVIWSPVTRRLFLDVRMPDVAATQPLKIVLEDLWQYPGSLPPLP